MTEIGSKSANTITPIPPVNAGEKSTGSNKAKTQSSANPVDRLSTRYSKDNVSGRGFGHGESPSVTDSLQNLRVSEKRSDLLRRFEAAFNGQYVSPLASEPLAKLQEQCFADNLPFVFGVRMPQRPFVGEKESIEIFPGSLLYDKIDAEDSREQFRDICFYLWKKGSTDPLRIGTIEQIEDDKNPLGFHLLLLNNSVFQIEDPEGIVGETFAACSILFRTGSMVPCDLALAQSLCDKVPAEQRSFHFGRTMIDALVEKDLTSAEACIPYGGSAHSVDGHGHIALLCVLEVEFLPILPKILSTMSSADDLLLLRATIAEDGPGLDWKVLRLLVECERALTKQLELRR